MLSTEHTDGPMQLALLGFGPAEEPETPVVLCQRCGSPMGRQGRGGQLPSLADYPGDMYLCCPNPTCGMEAWITGEEIVWYPGPPPAVGG